METIDYVARAVHIDHGQYGNDRQIFNYKSSKVLRSFNFFIKMCAINYFRWVGKIKRFQPDAIFKLCHHFHRFNTELHKNNAYIEGFHLE